MTNEISTELSLWIVGSAMIGLGIVISGDIPAGCLVFGLLMLIVSIVKAINNTV